MRSEYIRFVSARQQMLWDVEISDPVFKNIVGDFAGFLLLSCICSHSIIEWGQKFKLSLERCFHCRLNWTDYFAPISPPPCRQPIPTGLLFLPLWLYCALPLGASDHDTLQVRKHGHSTESFPGPTVPASQVTHAFIIHLYPLDLLLSLLFLLLKYFDSSGFNVRENWHVSVGTSRGSLPGTSRLSYTALLYDSMASCSTFISFILYFNHLFTGLFFSLYSECLQYRDRVLLFFP